MNAFQSYVSFVLAANSQRYFFIFTGESNSGGFALNSSPTSTELAPRPQLDILNNTTLVFEDLDVGTNNLIGHTSLTNNATHGLEIGLANLAAANLFGQTPCYLLKTGQGGSTIAQWSTGDVSGYWSTFLSRLATARGLLSGLAIQPIPIVFYSLGINDANAGTNVATWKAGVVDHLSRIRAELGAETLIFLTKFQGPNLTARASINTAIDEIVAADQYSKALDTTGLSVRDVNHWDYSGFLQLAERLFTGYFGTASGTLGTPTFSPPAGSYTSTQNVTISGTAGAQIRYTIDGSDPHAGSLLYSSPVSVASSSTLRAKQFAPGYAVSAVGSAAYTISAGATAPGAPTSVTAVAGNAQATVTFSAPASDGGATITGYTATSSPGGLTGAVSGASAAPITVVGLTNGTAYTFTVTATNSVGTSSPSSASNSVTPTAGVSWGTWSSLQNATQTAPDLISTGTTPGGGLINSVIDGSGAVSVMAYFGSQAAANAVVIALSKNNTADYVWHPTNQGSANVQALFYCVGASIYCGDNYHAVSPLVSGQTFPAFFRIRKSGSDAVFERSADGSSWTTLVTRTGTFSGAGNLYIKALFAAANVANTVRAASV
jgi:hypothetical protein